jgi:hypothetical protein
MARVRSRTRCQRARTFWRPAAVSTVTAGVVAYLTTLWRTNGEIRKLRAERNEAHYSNRQANYHNLLNAERELRAIVAEQQPGGPAEFVAAKSRFRECVNGVIISGSDEAVRYARDLDHVYFQSLEERGPTSDNVDWDLRDGVRRRFIEPVRADLGAPRSRRV